MEIKNMAAGLAIKSNKNYNVEKVNFTKKSSVEKLVEELFEAQDNKARARIENEIVELGKNAVPFLVSSLNEVKGQVRGIVAMSLIRIGLDSIYELKQFASKNQHMAWVANYLISEIKCNQH